MRFRLRPVLIAAVMIACAAEPSFQKSPAGAQAARQTAENPLLKMNEKFLEAWGKYPINGTAASPLPKLKTVSNPLFSYFPPLTEIATRDGMTVAGTKEGDLYVRGRHDETIRIVAKGSGAARWTIEDAEWSPDGRLLAVKTVDASEVPRITIRGEQFKPNGEASVPYSRIGEPLLKYRFFVVDRRSGKATPIQHDYAKPFVNVVGWQPDSSAVRLLQSDRFQKRLDLLTADAATGKVRLLHSEPRPISVTGLNLLQGYSHRLREQRVVMFLPDNSFIWMSDRSGFKHLYHHDPRGRLVRSLTNGKMPGWVDRIVDFDPERGLVHLLSAGLLPSDPVRNRLMRVEVGGSIKQLFEAGYIPAVKFSEDRRRIWVVRVGFPETSQIEEISSEGENKGVLWTADWSPLRATGYRTPEMMMVKAADGKTMLRALVMAPPNYDPAKRYPVIHRIYGGPNDAVVPPSPRNGSLWDLSTFARAGFVVVMIDGRGTPGRGREFQNFGYGRFGQVEIADQIEGLRNLAKTRPYMDLERVGLNGGSWGGYFGLRAALLAPDLYKAGVFGAGAYEMRRMRVSAEPYVGCSLQKCRERYDKASNLALIKRLKAPLLLFHGTADDDVPVEETKHLMAALDGAGKPYEFVEIPGWPHFYSNWPETSPRTVAFFQKHLGPPRTAGTH